MQRILSLLFIAANCLLSASLIAQHTQLPTPPGSGRFGTTVTVLSTGNYVVTDPFYSEGGLSNIGAVYLYFGGTHNIIGTLKGRSSNDRIGSGGVTALPNGHYVVSSPNWNDGIAVDAGAVTWCNGFMGGNAIVSSANSLVGVNMGDRVGSGGIYPLTNGNYIISSPEWGDGTFEQVGAATWASGTSPVSGFISGANSLTGLSAEDKIGSGKIYALPGGNYVINSPLFDNGAAVDAGAATWGDGTTGVSGFVNSTNSLVGSSTDDKIGSNGITVLNNGNYVVSSPEWNGTGVRLGAVTWANGNTGIAGAVSSINSLIGTTDNDQVGSRSVTALTNGHYVVNSPLWDNGATANAGAATWCDGTTGRTGTVTNANSLTGVNTNDQVSSSGSVALTNGNYVVCSYTWGDGVSSSMGAATWCDGTSTTAGTVNTTNSLVGSKTDDMVGLSAVPLTNGNYVVISPDWGDAADSNSGAVTWCDGTIPTSGVVSTSNSIFGQPDDQIGGDGVVALNNGNYVVLSSNWNNGSIQDAGAFTWANGTGTTAQMVTASNSVVGTQEDDKVGNGIFLALSNGNYVVSNPLWNNGATLNAGAVYFGNGMSGTSGEINAANALIGTSENDMLGDIGTAALNNGNYVIVSGNYDHSGIGNAGAVTPGDGMSGTFGTIQECNSIIGNSIDGGPQMSFAFNPLYNYLIVGKPYENALMLFDQNIPCDEPCDAPDAPLASDVEICFGETAQLSATGTGTLGWYDDPLDGNWLGGGENFQTPPLFGTTTYYVQDSTCAASEFRTPVTVTVHDLPVAGINNLTGTNTLSCTVSAITLQAYGGDSYAWSDGLGTDPMVIITQPGTYNVTVTNANGCVQDASININQLLQPPATPAVVYGEKNVCPYIGNGTQLQYEVDEDPLATSYTWTLPPSFSLVSGQGSNVITVTINNNFYDAHQVLRVRANSPCGNSGEKLFYLLAQLPVTPSPIQPSDTDVCPYLEGNGVITYTIPRVPAASGYIWTSPPGTTIHHPNGLGANDTIIEVTFTGSMATGLVSVRATNECGTSNARSLQVIRKNPSMPGVIYGSSDACAFMEPNGIDAYFFIAPVANTDNYEWTLPPNVSNVQGEGTTDISFMFPADFVQDVVSVRAVNGCGTSPARELKVKKLKVGTPSPIDVVQVSDCPDRVYTYQLSNMPPNSTFVNWTYPAGATLQSLPGLPYLTIAYPPGPIEGTVTAQGINNCSESAIRSLNIKLPACAPPEMQKSADYVAEKIEAEVSIYPNPTAHQFNLLVQHTDNAKVRVLDVTGRELMQFSIRKGEVKSFGKNLRGGQYLVEIIDGRERTVKKIIKSQ